MMRLELEDYQIIPPRFFIHCYQKEHILTQIEISL
jgi:hypothetical protein